MAGGLQTAGFSGKVKITGGLQQQFISKNTVIFRNST